VNIFHIGREGLANHPIPVPPPQEQRRIVAKVKALSARSTAVRAELARVEMLAARAKQVVLATAFNSYPRTAKVGDFVSAIEAGKNVRCQERPPQAHEKGLVKVSAVTWGIFDPAASKTLGPSEQPPERSRIRAGDFLFSRANTVDLVGACVIVGKDPKNLYLSDKILRLVMDDDDKRWLLWYLRSPDGRASLESASSGNQLSMRNISQAGLLDILVPAIPQGEKQQIAARIEGELRRISLTGNEAKNAAHLLDRLDQSILAKAFRGELVPQDPDDEPASAVLDRIRAQREAAGAPRRRGRNPRAEA
jgi:type I restriction enzyme S subunit